MATKNATKKTTSAADRKRATKSGKPVALPSGATRDQFGCPVGSGSHFVCAALCELSGAALAPVSLGAIITESERLAGGPAREPSGIINSLRLSRLVERAGRGAVKLTPAGWALYSSGKPSEFDGIKKQMMAVRAALPTADRKALPASAAPAKPVGLAIGPVKAPRKRVTK
jgi:hypothetical protein